MSSRVLHAKSGRATCAVTGLYGFLSVLALCATAVLADPLPDLGLGRELGASVALAMERNPAVAAAQAEWEAAVQRVPQARSLPDPMAEFMVDVRGVESGVQQQEQALSLSQMLPWLGRLRLRGEAAALEAEGAWQGLLAVRAEVAYEVARLHAERLFLERSLAITAGSMELLNGIEAVARERFRTGEAAAPALQVQVELGMLEDRLAELRQMEPVLVARLGAWLGLPSGTPLEPPSGSTALPDLPDESAIRRLVSAVNPGLEQARRSAQARTRGVDLARRSRYPDFVVEVRWVQAGGMGGGEGRDPVVATLGMTLPIWEPRNRAEIAEAKALQRAAHSRQEAQAASLDADVEAALFDRRDARRRVRLYQDALLPKALEAFSGALQAFRAGAGGFAEAVDAQRRLLELELALERGRRDETIASAAVRRLMGFPTVGAAVAPTAADGSAPRSPQTQEIER